MKTILPIVALLALLAVVILAARNQRVLEAGLPPRIECASEAEARERAGAGAVRILGTGSMAPYIPAAPAGRDPHATTVAFAVMEPGATFADIATGKLCTYRPEWDAKAHVIHGAAARDGLGWIMSGLHNARSESWARVTAANFTGIVARVYVWPLEGAE